MIHTTTEVEQRNKVKVALTTKEEIFVSAKPVTSD
jgi:hypothetical protein